MDLNTEMPIQPARVSSIEMRDVHKAFGATVAVDGASFSIRQGHVHALLGENGAGKSTAVKLLSGLTSPDSGEILLHGKAIRVTSPRVAQAAGIQTAFQEITLVRDLSVLENMLIPHAPIGPLGMIRKRMVRDQVSQHLQSLGLGHINLNSEVRDLDLPIRQKLEIARALYRQPSILLLDEPTSALSGRDVTWVGDIIAAERKRGTTIVFISHRLREVRDFCEEVTVLRNGKDVLSGSIGDYSDNDIIRQIVGRSINQAFPAKLPNTVKAAPGEIEELLGARQLCAGRVVDASFSLRNGEILGVSGLQGMGQLDLFLACFGMAEIRSGSIRSRGRDLTLGTPTDAIDNDIGISLVPEDRKTEGLFLKLNGRHNASLPVIQRFSRLGIIDADAEMRVVRQAFRRVNVDERALWTRAGAFSGGNQQKIAIAKWLLSESAVLLLFDPTRGIDVGTKHELYQLMRDFAAAGGGILLYSTEIPELVHLADRVIVLYQGRITTELAGQDLTEEAIASAALGAEPERVPA